MSKEERIEEIRAEIESIREDIRGLHYHDIDAQIQWDLIALEEELEELEVNKTSWVIVENKTGKAVLETFEEKTANHIRAMNNYTVMPILEYLHSLNRKEK